MTDVAGGTECAPCPWCGNGVEVETYSIRLDGVTFWEWFHIKHRCAMFGLMVSRDYSTREECVRKWNGRTR